MRKEQASPLNLLTLIEAWFPLLASLGESPAWQALMYTRYTVYNHLSMTAVFKQYCIDAVPQCMHMFVPIQLNLVNLLSCKNQSHILLSHNTVRNKGVNIYKHSLLFCCLYISFEAEFPPGRNVKVTVRTYNRGEARMKQIH